MARIPFLFAMLAVATLLIACTLQEETPEVVVGSSPLSEIYDAAKIQSWTTGCSFDSCGKYREFSFNVSVTKEILVDGSDFFIYFENQTGGLKSVPFTTNYEFGQRVNVAWQEPSFSCTIVRVSDGNGSSTDAPHCLPSFVNRTRNEIVWNGHTLKPGENVVRIWTEDFNNEWVDLQFRIDNIETLVNGEKQVFSFDSKQKNWIVWDNGEDSTTFRYYRNITLNSNSTTNLTNFPAAFIMDTQTLITAGKMNDTCKDLRPLINTTTVGKYEIVAGTCNTTKTLVYVQIPNFGNNSNPYTVRVYYGNNSVEGKQNLSALWGDANYTAVYHFSNATLPPQSANKNFTLDSTVNKYNATIEKTSGTPAFPKNVTNVLDVSSMGYNLTPGDRSWVIPTNLSLVRTNLTNYTMTTWTRRSRATGSFGAWNVLGSGRDSANNVVNFFQLIVCEVTETSSGKNLSFYMEEAYRSGRPLNLNTCPNQNFKYTNDTWLHIAFFYDYNVTNGTVGWYFNGTLQWQQNYSGQQPWNDSHRPTIGSDRGHATTGGDFGETRFANVKRSDDWIRAEWGQNYSVSGEVWNIGYLNITWKTPVANANHINSTFVEYTVNVTCYDGWCGNVYAYLDPTLVTLIPSNATTGADVGISGALTEGTYTVSTRTGLTSTCYNQINTSNGVYCLENEGTASLDAYFQTNFSLPPNRNGIEWVYFNGEGNTTSTATTCQLAYWNVTAGGYQTLATGSCSSTAEANLAMNWSGQTNITSAVQANSVVLLFMHNSSAINDDLNLDFMRLVLAYNATLYANNLTENTTTYAVLESVNHTFTLATNASLSAYIFEWNATGASCTGGYTNDSAVTLSANGQGVFGVTKTLPNACGSKTIGWRIWANNTDGQMNQTPYETYTLGAAGPIIKNGTLVSNVTGDLPFYTNWTNPRLPTDDSCLQDMQAGESCIITYYVNATGKVATAHIFNAFANSTVNQTQTWTNNLTITITAPGGGGDTCDYGGTGNFVTNCAENCIVDNVEAIEAGKNWTLSGTGTVYVNNNVTGWACLIKFDGCTLVKPDGVSLVSGGNCPI